MPKLDRSIWWSISILSFAFAVQIYHLDTQSLWFDEGWSAFGASQPTLIAAFESDTTNPPLYYVLLNIHVKLSGDSEFNLRWFSTLMNLLAVALCGQLARRLFNRRAGVYALLLAACLPLTRWAAQEARMYTLMLVLIILMALAWHQLLRQPKRWAWVTLWLAELALLYAHNTGVIAALWINLVMLLYWLLQRNFKRPSLGIWAAGQMAIALLWSPWLIRFMDLTGANSAVVSRPELNLALITQIWRAFWVGSWDAVLRNEPVVNVLAGVSFIITVLIFPWRKPAARWLFLHFLILIVGVVLALVTLQNPLHSRYLVIAAPFLVIPLAAGIARLSLPPLRYLASFFFVGVLAYSIDLSGKPEFQHDDTRAIVRYYAENLSSQDSVLAWSYARPFHLEYYWDKLGVDARLVTLPEGADLETVMPLVPSTGSVALNVWYGQRADYSGMLNCALTDGNPNPAQTYTVPGMTSQLYAAPARQAPMMRPFDATFEVATLTAIRDFPVTTAERALCLPIDITLTQIVGVDLKARVMIRNPLGWTITTTDAIFSKPDYRLSSRLSAGDTLSAYPLIWMPYGTPAGEYDVFLRIYDEQVETSGYDVLSASGSPTGKDLNLGTWTIRPGADWSQVNRKTDLPTVVNLRLSDDITLLAHNGSAETPPVVNNGDRLPLTLLWQGAGALPDLTLRAADAAWEISIPSQISSSHDPVTLDWREIRVPVDAGSGTAELTLPDGTVIARYVIEKLDAQFIEPEYGTVLNVPMPGVGELVGFTLATQPFAISAPAEIQLVWKATGEASADYTVFVQLLDTEGELIAQSDSVPVEGQRPTTGWRADEYIIDTHQLRFNENAAPGEARLIIGMYDAVTGQRIPVQPGIDYITAADSILIR
jgi:4-amino-4-deoxy-L-arabinose transferase-like glycosyltransferase